MAYNTDWDNLMNGAFGRRSTEATKNAMNTLDSMETQLQAILKKQGENLKAMNRELKAREATQTAKSLSDQMELDGLLTAQQRQEAEAKAANPNKGSWQGIDAVLNQSLMGQPDFTKALVRAFRRPTVMEVKGDCPKNIILVSGGSGSGRHTALRLLAEELNLRGLISSAQISTLDLSRYPGPAQEKAFLQDLFNALNSKGEIVAFDNYQAAAPGCLQMIASLCDDGNLPLSGRYLEQKGILVDVGTALAPGAVSSLSAKNKYFVFFSNKGLPKMAEKFGATFVDLIGDVCEPGAYSPEALAAIAARELNELAANAKKRLSFKLSAGAEARDWLAGQYCKATGVQAIVTAAERVYKALAQYKLEEDPADNLPVALTVEDGTLMFTFGQAQPVGLAALLPTGYTGELAAAQAELDGIIGLDEIKDYVRSLADNVQAQQRRKAAGLPTASVSMHTIFAGNPGTGKTTIARILGKYLKAIGALRGGQLIEVSRADLVGRYVGHTAPLTNQVIQSALGGVLFIDEAYSLYRGNDDSFGLEAIDTLVKGMEDHRDDVVVILAGYSREMEVFLTANSGLASRFPNRIEFPDYTGQQLLDILLLQAKGKGYAVAESCKMPLLTFFERTQAENAAQAGNGRLARNVLEAAILQQAKRLVADPDAPLDELILQDFNLD